MGWRKKTGPAETEGPEPRHIGNEDDHDERYGKPYKYEADFSGPIKKRSCTDILCLLLFLAFLGGWGFVAYFGISKGDIDKVLYPTDSHGQICGKGQLKDRPYLLFYDLTRCLNPAAVATGCPTPQVCVEKCPDKNAFGYGLSVNGNDAQAKNDMRPFCAKNATMDKPYEDLVKEKTCPAWVLESKPFLGRCLPSLSIESGNNDDKTTVIEADQTVNKEPISKGTLKGAITSLGAFLSLRDWGEKIFNDLRDTWWMIGIGLTLAFVLSSLWIILMRFLTAIMVWTSIGLSFILMSGLFGFSLYKYLLIKDEPSKYENIFHVNYTPNFLEDVLALKDTWLAFTIITGIFTSIILLILIALRQRIQIAIKLIEQGAKAVGHMCSSIFFPIVPFLLHVVIVAWFGFVAIYLSSAGEKTYSITYNDESGINTDQSGQWILRKVEEIVPEGCFSNGNCINSETKVRYMENDTCTPDTFDVACKSCPEITCQFTRYSKIGGGWFGSWMNWYNIFGFLWSMELVTAFGEMVLAGVFAKWYWTWDKKDVPVCSLGASFCNTLTFHMGTLAFGSLVIAIIRFIRTILEYVEKKLNAFNNDLTRCLLCLCKCCLWCLEKFMRFINRNAYIMCAMKSTNFCVSSKDAFNLLMRNMMRVVVLNNVVAFLLLMGKLVIMAGVGTLSYFVFSGRLPGLQEEIPTLNYLFTPIVVIVVGTYFITSSFFSVYSMAVDTLFLCFLEDLERNDGTPSRPYFMSKGLQDVVGEMNQFKLLENPEGTPLVQLQK